MNFRKIFAEENVMNEALLKELSKITDEEQKILDGEKMVNRQLYYDPNSVPARENEVDSSRVLANGRLIDIRPNTRFVHFPKHTHNFVEFVYMCKGQTTHMIDDQKIILKEGDLLFMNQHATQEIEPAGVNDIAVNFMILPQFFDSVLRTMDVGDSSLRDFIVSCLTDQNMDGNYLYFDVAGVLPIQNLMENLIWTMMTLPHDHRKLAQSTMAVLFMNLMDYADRIHVADSSYEQRVVIQLLNYIETQYKSASLADFCNRQGMDIYTMSRLIKKKTGSTFKDLLIKKRLEQAVFLLKNTNLSVAAIAFSVGYENTSYFHRIFLKEFGMSPRNYRLESVRPQ